MSTRTYTLTFSGGETIPLPGGVFFLVTRASSALTIRTRGTPGSPLEFSSVGAGLSYGPVTFDKKWTYLDVTSAAAQVVEVIVSEEGEVKVGSVVSVSGSVETVAQPSTTLATPARIACGTGADVLLVAVNAARKLVRIQVPSTETRSIVTGPTGSLGASQGFEIQPGTNEPFSTTAAIYARGVGGSVNVQVFEET